ncbi:GTPase IMAP family member 4-like [Alosa sapidissima]|uniref:GTPase IMAP family member 4-like n=1 Tax=Alosa sapidissima TaxID=34773 RepID=UPI001C090927|nr:GTPase IMAP family member 4-like [Alosa sapidissima]XP_041959067.1 GTPase IMAP family member 4-like [Alosa sapidissima]XP_041959068.1 GTPase IMAP family member 4-like [Alosa sapidissima]XP_041959069.1 GTPase IMAP family member 4-like [Alosa sapidissima]
MMATGGSSAQDDRRVVLLGKIGAGKSSLANRLLGGKAFKKEEAGLCVRRQGEHAGRKLTVVDTPGWDRVSVQRTPEHIKQEIIRSTSLCLPGPHALLLVLPISMDGDPPSANEMKSASHHVELLSPRAWRHTMVLFVCKDEMEKSVIDRHVQGAKKLTDKCEGRFFILERDNEVSHLLQKIEDIVEQNCGDFLIPQVYYEVFEKRMPSGIVEQSKMYERREEELKEKYKEKLQKMEAERDKALRRRGSFELLPPTMSDTSKIQHQDSEIEKIELQPLKQGYHEEFVTIPRYYIKMLMVIMAAVVGAFVGAIGGADKGALGSCTGMASGFLIGLLMGLLVIGVTKLVKGNTSLTLVFGGTDQNPQEKMQGPRDGSHSPKTCKKEKEQ